MINKCIRNAATNAGIKINNDDDKIITKRFVLSQKNFNGRANACGDCVDAIGVDVPGGDASGLRIELLSGLLWLLFAWMSVETGRGKVLDK